MPMENTGQKFSINSVIFSVKAVTTELHISDGLKMGRPSTLGMLAILAEIGLFPSMIKAFGKFLPMRSQYNPIYSLSIARLCVTRLN
jgi:hypothetical protein